VPTAILDDRLTVLTYSMMTICLAGHHSDYTADLSGSIGGANSASGRKLGLGCRRSMRRAEEWPPRGLAAVAASPSRKKKNTLNDVSDAHVSLANSDNARSVVRAKVANQNYQCGLSGKLVGQRRITQHPAREMKRYLSCLVFIAHDEFYQLTAKARIACDLLW